MAAISAVAVLAGGCATSNTPGDPFEGFNRGVFGFNEGVDQAIVKPIAKGYTAVVPEPARDCVISTINGNEMTPAKAQTFTHNWSLDRIRSNDIAIGISVSVAMSLKLAKAKFQP